jgi:hypothetical protein
VVPKSASVPLFVIKNNLRTAGISSERFFEILGCENYNRKNHNG